MDIDSLRSRIDKLDTKIIRLLKRRFKTVEKLSTFKKQEGLPIKDALREERMHKSIAKKAESFHLNPIFTKKLFNLILDESKKLQKNR